MGNSTNKLNKEVIENHNNTTAKYKKKLLLIGINKGKSHWFNHSEKDKPLSDITYKTAAFNIGDKLPDIECIIYDTPEDEHFFDVNSTGLKNIGSASGIILTYCTHNFDALNYLEKCIDILDEHMSRKAACLLLGMTETRKNNTENNFYYAELIIERANQLASKYRLMHMQLDISINIKTDTPYVCLLRKIMKQKQDPMSPVVEYDMKFDEEKQDITDDPFVLNQYNNTYPDIDLIPKMNVPINPPPAWPLQPSKSKELAIYQSAVYGNDKLLRTFPNGDALPNTDDIIPIVQHNQYENHNNNIPNIHRKSAKIHMQKQFSLKSLNAYETNEKRVQAVVYEEKQKESIFDKVVQIDDDMICKMEFERFFEQSLGKKRSNKYIGMFKQNQYDDIRLVDPDIFDGDFFKSDHDIKMNKLDQKLFQKEIKKYNNDKIKFENILDSVNMKEKYRKTFENRGIATLWSFHYYISSIKHIQIIIKNKNDSKIIWNELGGDEIADNNNNKSIADNEGNNHHKGSSDSEEMYNEHHNGYTDNNNYKYRKQTDDHIATGAVTSYAEGGI